MNNSLRLKIKLISCRRLTGSRSKKFTAVLISIIIYSLSVNAQSIYDFKVMAIDSSEIDFSNFKGKYILIVNTASKCGYTPQYKALEEMNERHKEDLVIIGFPANNFLWQEPGDNNKIKNFCQINYGVTFPLAAKVSVKGKKIHPLFKWLIELPNPDFTGDIKWNFEKFLFDKEGKLLRRFRSKVVPGEVEKSIYD